MHPSVVTWISAVVSEGICTLIPSNMHQTDEVMRLKEVGKVVKHMWQSGPFFGGWGGFEISRLGLVKGSPSHRNPVDHCWFRDRSVSPKKKSTDRRLEEKPLSFYGSPVL